MSDTTDRDVLDRAIYEWRTLRPQAHPGAPGYEPGSRHHECHLAATEITTLRAENERLREQADALKHLVNAASEVDEAIGYRDWKRVASRGKTLTAALVLARAALKGG